MARSYAKIHVDIWSDQDFLALSRDAMVTYLFLLAQPKMRSCGVIDMQANRWAKKLDMTTEELASALNLLEGGRFVAIDYTTDELAVRTFVKHDAGDTKNWKVWTGVWSSLGAVESIAIREFGAANIPSAAFDPKAKPLFDSPPGTQWDWHSDTQSDPVTVGEDTQSDYQSDYQSGPNPIPNGIGSGISLSLSETVSDTETTTEPNPLEPVDNSQSVSDESALVVQLPRTDRGHPAVRMIADYEFMVAEGSGVRIDNPVGYLIGIRRRVEDDERFHRIIADNPTATAEQIRDIYLAPDPLESYDELLRNPTTRYTGHPYAANVTEMGDHTTHNTNGVEKRSQRVGTA